MVICKPLKIRKILTFLLFYLISTPLWCHKKISTENWMKNLYHKLPETRLRDILIPGTNNSDSYKITNSSPLAPKTNRFFLLKRGTVSKWTKTQNLTILEQLKKGIRYIELNLMKYKGEFFSVNGLISVNLNVVLKDLHTWAAKHPHEIVLINANLSLQTLSEAKGLHRAISKHIGQFLAFPLLPPSLLTFKDLWTKEKGRPLIFLAPPSFKKISPRYWNKKKVIQLNKTNSRNKKDLLEQTLYGGSGLFNQGWSKFYISELIFKPNAKTIIKSFFENGAPKSLFQLSKPLNNVPGKSISYWLEKDLSVNIIKMNFFEKTNLIATCLEANKKSLIEGGKNWH